MKDLYTINNILSASDELKDVYSRLQDGETISFDELASVPEVRTMLEDSQGTSPTIEWTDRQEIWNEVAEKEYALGSYTRTERDENGNKVEMFDGEVKTGNRLDLVIGLPGAGKSSVIVNALSNEVGARIVDSDVAKRFIPENADGKHANLVHAESAQINNKVRDIAMSRGENIIMPIIGSKGDEVLNGRTNPDGTKDTKGIVEIAKENGYKVYVHYVDIPVNESIGRVIVRNIEEGRSVPPTNLEKYIEKDGNDKPVTDENGKYISMCDKSYETIKNDDRIEGYSHWNNDVSVGEKPELIEAHNTDLVLTGEKDIAKDEEQGVTEKENSWQTDIPVTGGEEKEKDDTAGGVTAGNSEYPPDPTITEQEEKALSTTSDSEKVKDAVGNLSEELGKLIAEEAKAAEDEEDKTTNDDDENKVTTDETGGGIGGGVDDDE